MPKPLLSEADWPEQGLHYWVTESDGFASIHDGTPFDLDVSEFPALQNLAPGIYTEQEIGEIIENYMASHGDAPAD